MTTNLVYLWLILPAIGGVVSWLYGVSWRVGVAALCFSSASLIFVFGNKNAVHDTIVTFLSLLVGFHMLSSSALVIKTRNNYKKFLEARHWLLRTLAVLVPLLVVMVPLFVLGLGDFPTPGSVKNVISNSSASFTPFIVMIVGSASWVLIFLILHYLTTAIGSLRIFRRRDHPTQSGT